MLKISKLTAKINDANKSKTILESVDIQLKPGEIHLLMGSNGAGKSTLSKAIMGYPEIDVEGSIKLDDKEIITEATDVRSRAGLFISHQQPVEIPGVKLLEFMKTAYNGQRESKDRVDIWAFLTIFEKAIKEAGLPEEFVDRELNAGFSGGEKKKSEVLQLLVLKPKYAILDEIDSGLDIDAVKLIYTIINKLAQESKSGFLLITHNPNILEYIKPDKVHILSKGKIKETGGIELAEKTLKKGFK